MHAITIDRLIKELEEHKKLQVSEGHYSEVGNCWIVRSLERSEEEIRGFAVSPTAHDLRPSNLIGVAMSPGKYRSLADVYDALASFASTLQMLRTEFGVDK